MKNRHLVESHRHELTKRLKDHGVYLMSLKRKLTVTNLSRTKYAL